MIRRKLSPKRLLATLASLAERDDLASEESVSEGGVTVAWMRPGDRSRQVVIGYSEPPRRLVLVEYLRGSGTLEYDLLELGWHPARAVRESLARLLPPCQATASPPGLPLGPPDGSPVPSPCRFRRAVQRIVGPDLYAAASVWSRSGFSCIEWDSGDGGGPGAIGSRLLLVSRSRNGITIEKVETRTERPVETIALTLDDLAVALPAALRWLVYGSEEGGAP